MEPFTMDGRCNRRAILRVTGLICTGALAGCASGGDGGDDGTDRPSGGTATATATPTATAAPTDTPSATATPSPTQTDTGGGETTIEEFLAGTSNYDGIEDVSGTTDVEVDVGVEGNGAFFAFGPPAVRISQGTTVSWTWTGQGGIHNVKAIQGADFESESKSEAGATFRRQFDDPGTVLYACIPHQGAGMKGAVVVE